jgi:hypothetical protein
MQFDKLLPALFNSVRRQIQPLKRRVLKTMYFKQTAERFNTSAVVYVVVVVVVVEVVMVAVVVWWW